MPAYDDRTFHWFQDECKRLQAERDAARALVRRFIASRRFPVTGRSGAVFQAIEPTILDDARTAVEEWGE